MNRAAAVFFFALFALFASDTASAGLFRAYLSANGNDANPCTLQKPCRLLPAALAAVNDGGDVWMLDSGNFNTGPVTVTKSVTILAVPGALGSLVTPLDADGLTISIDANFGRVTLRNLLVRDQSGPAFGIAGVRLVTGRTLRIENCEIYGVNIGIAADADNSSMTIANTTIHDTGEIGVGVSRGEAAMDGLSVSNSSLAAVQAENGAHVTVSNSTFSGNGVAIEATGTTSTGTVVDVAHTTISATGGIAVEIGADVGTVAEVFLHSTTIHADTGFFFNNPLGTANIFSYGDNRLVFYSASAVGGSLTPISGI